MKPPRKHDNELILGLVSVLEENDGMTYDDKTVSSLEKWFKDTLTTPVTIHKRVIANQRFSIEKSLRELVDIIGCDLVMTTGGIGPSRYDVVPESTLAVATRSLPGFANALRQQTVDPLLSRPQAVLRDTPEQTALIINVDTDEHVLKALADTRDSDGKITAEGLFNAMRRCLLRINGPQIGIRDGDCDEMVDFKCDSVSMPTAYAEKPETETAVPETETNDNVRREDVSGITQVPAFDSDDILTIAPSRTRMQPEATVIWLHGMGVDNTDFADFPDQILQLGGPVCRFILPNAPVREISAHPGYPLRAWYDVLSDRFEDQEDKYGINETAMKVSRLISELAELGVNRRRIFLGGFSQGAAMALYAGLRQTHPIGGVIALSGYLPLAADLFKDITSVGRSTPVFMAHGDFDSVIPPLTAQRGAKVIQELNNSLIWKTFPIDHSVSTDELMAMTLFLRMQLRA